MYRMSLWLIYCVLTTLLTLAASSNDGSRFVVYDKFDRKMVENRPRISRVGLSGVPDSNNEIYTTSLTSPLPRAPPHPSSLVSGLLVTRMASDIARLSHNAMKSRETRIPVYVAYAEPDEDGLPNSKSIPKLIHLLDAQTVKQRPSNIHNEEPSMLEEPRGLPIYSERPQVGRPYDQQYDYPEELRRPQGYPVVRTDEKEVIPFPLPINAPHLKELDMMEKIQKLLEKQQQQLFKQHIETVVKEQLQELVKSQMALMIRQPYPDQSEGRVKPEAQKPQEGTPKVGAAAYPQTSPQYPSDKYSSDKYPGDKKPVSLEEQAKAYLEQLTGGTYEKPQQQSQQQQHHQHQHQHQHQQNHKIGLGEAPREKHLLDPHIKATEASYGAGTDKVSVSSSSAPSASVSSSGSEGFEKEIQRDRLATLLKQHLASMQSTPTSHEQVAADSSVSHSSSASSSSSSSSSASSPSAHDPTLLKSSESRREQIKEHIKDQVNLEQIMDQVRANADFDRRVYFDDYPHSIRRMVPVEPDEALDLQRALLHKIKHHIRSPRALMPRVDSSTGETSVPVIIVPNFRGKHAIIPISP